MFCLASIIMVVTCVSSQALQAYMSRLHACSKSRIDVGTIVQFKSPAVVVMNIILDVCMFTRVIIKVASFRKWAICSRLSTLRT